MGSTIFWRIVWKEYRTQRWFWLGVAGFAAVAWLLILASVDRAHDRTALLYVVAWALPALYALGCGAVLFAGEREAGTFQLLRQLPHSTFKIVCAKLGFGLASTGLLILVLPVAAWILAGFRLPREVAYPAVLTWQLAALEFFAWGLFCSLLISRPLSAVCIAALTALLLRAAWPYGLYLLPAVLVADVWLASRWLSDPRSGWLLFPERFGRAKVLTTAARELERVSPENRAFQRLVWHELRQALSISASFVPAGLLIVALAGGVRRSLEFSPAFFLIAGTPLLMGLGAFRGQRHGGDCLFLAERGVAARTVWLSKHLVWIPLALVAVSLFVAFEHFAQQFWNEFWDRRGSDDRFSTIFQSMRPWRSHSTHPYSPWAIGFVLLSSYGIGQFLSLLLRSAVTAACAGFGLLWALIAWFTVVTVWLKVPLALSLLPIPAALLAATYVRSGGWLMERHDWRAWAKVWVASGVPLLGLLVGVISFRVFEIPRAKLMIDEDAINRPLTSDERQTVEMYSSATSALLQFIDKDEPTPYEAEQAREPVWEGGWGYATGEQERWLAGNAEPIRLALEAAQRGSGRRLDATQAKLGEWTVDRTDLLADLLMFSARKLEAEGEVDAALERWVAVLRLAHHVASRGRAVPEWELGHKIYARALERLPLWAAAPGQTPERIVAAIATIEGEASRFPSYYQTVVVEHVLLKRAIVEDDPAVWEYVSQGPFTVALLSNRAFRRAPWELARAQRGLDRVTLAKQIEMWALDHAVMANQSLVRPHSIHKDDRNPQPVDQWIATTPALHHMTTFDRELLAVNIVRPKMELRAALTQLALSAWRLEHGELPGRLQQLDNIASERTLDPWTGRSFEYYPAGLPHSVRFSNRRIAARQPFVWSVGPRDARIMRMIYGPPRLEVQDAEQRWYQGTPAEYEPAPAWAFPIPPQTLPAPEVENAE